MTHRIHALKEKILQEIVAVPRRIKAIPKLQPLTFTGIHHQWVAPQRRSTSRVDFFSVAAFSVNDEKTFDASKSQDGYLDLGFGMSAIIRDKSFPQKWEVEKGTLKHRCLDTCCAHVVPGRVGGAQVVGLECK